jgi:hypothetical protein
MARAGYIAEVKRRLQGSEPDLTRLLTYEQIAEQYGDRLRRLGLGATSKAVQATMRTLTSQRILHRYEVVNRIRIPANEVEVYLDVLEEPRPVV